MKKTLKTTLSLILAFVILVLAMPAYAAEINEVKEVEALREENVKHFEMPDGTFKAVVYSEPVHRKDADGNWQDIDNTLTSVSKNGLTDYASSDGRIKFSKDIKSADGRIFELNENGYSISFSLIDENAKSVTADIKNHKGRSRASVFASQKTQLEKLQSVDNLTNIRYNGIKDNIDIEYEIYSNSVKESIIVNSRQNDYTYKFNLAVKNMIAVLNDDGTISLRDDKTGDEKYVMPAPFMFDSNGVLSNDVSYTLTEKEESVYELTVIADTEWINSDERVFPVTIDPTTVYVYTDYGEAYVSSSSPTTNYKKPSNGGLLVSPTNRTFLKFAMPELALNAEITEATLIMNYYYTSNIGYMDVAIYKVPYSWDENTITWNNSVASHTAAENATTRMSTEYVSATNSTSSASPATIYFDMTDAVEQWCSGVTNNGVALKYYTGTNNTVTFCGYNSGSDKRPTLEIIYNNNNNMVFYFGNVGDRVFAEAETTNIKLSLFEAKDNQKWNLQYLPSGYYVIRCAETGKVLSAPSSINNKVTLNTYTASTAQHWKITKDSNGYYRIASRNNLTRYISSSDSYLYLTNSKSDNSDEWVISTYVDYVLAFIVETGTFDTLELVLQNVENSLRTNTHMIGVDQSQMSTDQMLLYLSNTSFFACLTHGTSTTIDTNSGVLTVSDINSLSNTAFDNLRFVYLGACDTGMPVTSGTNLVDAIYNKGADAVLGFVHQIDQDEGNYWTEQFILSLSYGNTIAQAMVDADNNTRMYITPTDDEGYTTTENFRYLRGSDQIVPCH